MEDSATARSLTILTRSSAAREQQTPPSRHPSLLSVEESSTSAALSTVSSARRDPQQRYSPPLLSRPATPPPDADEDTSSQNQLISGVGGRFPAMPSRASSLTMGSESASHASVATPDNRSQASGGEYDEDGEDFVTPRVEQRPWTNVSVGTPERRITTRNCIVVQTHPPMTPSPSPRRSKRVSPPLPTPCPSAKRRKVEAHRGPDAEEADRHGSSRVGLISHQALQNTIHRASELAGADFLDNGHEALSAIEQIQLDNNSGAKDDGSNGTQVIRRAQSLPDLVTSAPAQNNLTLTPVSSTRSAHPDTNQATIEIEWLGEDEIEAQLFALLSSYRQFYQDTDSPGSEQRADDAVSGRAARHTFKTIFEERLSSAEDEGSLLQEEEEDVMNTFMEWIRDLGLPRAAMAERVPSLCAGLDWIKKMAAENHPTGLKALWPFVRKISLLPDSGAQFGFGELPTVDAIGPWTRRPDGATVWEFERIASAVQQPETWNLSDDDDFVLLRGAESDSKAEPEEW